MCMLCLFVLVCLCTCVCVCVCVCVVCVLCVCVCCVYVCVNEDNGAASIYPRYRQAIASLFSHSHNSFAAQDSEVVVSPQGFDAALDFYAKQLDHMSADL